MPVSEQPVEASAEQAIGSAPVSQHATSSNAASRRVSAAAAAAGVAASGSSSTEGARAASPARTDTAVAAASAAAAAAVAAVSAAIAATAATNGTSADVAKGAPAPKRGARARTRQVAAAAAAAGAAAAAAPVAHAEAHAVEVAPVEEAPVELAAQSLPAAPETLLPSHSYITRAGSSDEVPEFHPPVEPLFSNEGIVRQSVANHRSIFQRIAAVPAGVAAALAAAGTALGHTVGSRLPAGKSAAGSPPEGLGGASVVDAPTPGPEAAPSGGVLASADSAVASAAAVVAGAVLWPINKISGRGAAARLASVEVEYSGNERRRRRAPIFWALFIGFYGILAGYVVVGGLILPAVAEAPSPSPKGGIGVVDLTVHATQTTLPSATTSAMPNATTPTPTTTTPAVVATASATASAAPSAAPTTTPKPTASPTVKPTPTPTPTPTPSPTPTPTPTPTPRPLSVSLASEGSTFFYNGITYAVAYSAAHTEYLNVRINTVGGAQCTLSTAGSTNSPWRATASADNWDLDYVAFHLRIGGSWTAGTWTLTAQCTLNGVTRTDTHSIIIT
ncbi:MAG: hypothetical protein ABSD62_08450 [Candidatus Limnocylindrales bacterium]